MFISFFVFSTFVFLLDTFVVIRNLNPGRVSLSISPCVWRRIPFPTGEEGKRISLFRHAGTPSSIRRKSSFNFASCPNSLFRRSSVVRCRSSRQSTLQGSCLRSTVPPSSPQEKNYLSIYTRRHMLLVACSLRRRFPGKFRYLIGLGGRIFCIP